MTPIAPRQFESGTFGEMGGGGDSSGSATCPDLRLVRTIAEAVWTREELGEPGAWVVERVRPRLDGAVGLRDDALASRAQCWCFDYRFRRGMLTGLGERNDTQTSERLLRLVLETLPLSVQVMDREGKLILFNEEAVRRIWGAVIAPPGERYARSIGYWHESGERIARDEWASQRALRHGESRSNQLVDIVSFDGERRTIKNSAAPLRDDSGEILGAVVVNEDVTEALRARDEIERRERQQAALAQLGLFALRSAHTKALFDEAAALVARTLGVEYGAVFEWMPDEQRMEMRARSGPWDAETIARVTVPTMPGFMAWFYLRSTTPVVVRDLPRETRFAPCELLAAHGVQSGIAVPIAGKSHAFGVLEVNSKTTRTFTEDEIQFAWSAANVLASSIAREQSADELRDKRTELQTLSRRLIEVQEAERRAVARELHDDFGQVLTALRMNLQRPVPDEKENIALVDGAIARMRDLVQDLRPPQLDELGLEESIRWYVQREARRAGLEVTTHVEALGAEPPSAVATAIFRVMQEALTNVMRHANARAVTATLRRVDAYLELVVRDDGKGFVIADARKRAARGESYGLLGMKERVELVGGALEIDSVVGGGTTLRARLPLSGKGPS